MTRDHGLLDRMLHRVAFGTTLAQRGMADLEERLFRRELAAFEPGPPVFVTALPRAGTTILLEVIAGLPEFAAHTYRDMPFVLSPMIWQSLSRPFQRSDAPRERMHGDGIEITHDSPEAFEEVLWRSFWPAHYGPDSIEPWEHCRDAEFLEFFATHRKKVIALRRREKPTAGRYVSKNNANIARIPALLDALPDATVVVPFRRPDQHAASLLRQHERFSQLHARDAFAKRYMAAIGHFDFGANLKPLRFPGLEDAGHDPNGLAFWVGYWIVAYREVLRHAEAKRVHLIGFESLGKATDLIPLAKVLATEVAPLNGRASLLRPIADRNLDADLPRLDEALDLYAELQTRSVLQ